MAPFASGVNEQPLAESRPRNERGGFGSSRCDTTTSAGIGACRHLVAAAHASKTRGGGVARTVKRIGEAAGTERIEGRARQVESERLGRSDGDAAVGTASAQPVASQGGAEIEFPKRGRVDASAGQRKKLELAERRAFRHTGDTAGVVQGEAREVAASGRRGVRQSDGQRSGGGTGRRVGKGGREVTQPFGRVGRIAAEGDEVGAGGRCPRLEAYRRHHQQAG